MEVLSVHQQIDGEIHLVQSAESLIARQQIDGEIHLALLVESLSFAQQIDGEILPVINPTPPCLISLHSC